MSRIASIFTGGRKALVGYIPVGYPDLEATVETACNLAESGCDILELGIPFSDPLADGATIQKATHQALLNGITVNHCLEAALQLSGRVHVALTFMGYLNPLLRYGLQRFCSDCGSAGIDGLIIPDLPQGEMPELGVSAARHGLDVIRFLAPNSTDARIGRVAKNSSGFIYVVSVTGVTGARDSFSSNLGNLIQRTRKATRLPLCVGFGISDAGQARRVAEIADGVIVGSKIIQLMEEGNGAQPGISRLISELRKTIDSAV